MLQKFLLLFFIQMFLMNCLFASFNDEVNESNAQETLLKLKLAITESVTDEESIDEQEANKILTAIKENIPPSPVSTEEKPKEKKLKKEKAKKKQSKQEKPKKSITKKKVFVKKKLMKSKTDKKIVKKEVLVKDNIVEVQKMNTAKDTSPQISLGEQNDIHTLSETERRSFEHLEVVSTSRVFVLEAEPEVKSPIYLEDNEKNVKLDDLHFVETLGVVSQSIPSTNKDE